MLRVKSLRAPYHDRCHLFAPELSLRYGYAARSTSAPEKIKRVARPESIGQRLHRLRTERGLSQRDLSAPGISYAYISRIEAGARTPSVKALRQIANKLGVTVEHLETGDPTPIERGIADAGLDFGSLTAKELRAVQTAADRGARESAHHAAEQVIEDRRKAEVANLRKRLKELSG